MGGYGFLRFSLPMFPEASAQFAWLVFGLSMVAVVYTSLVALVQNDMKKLIAYSSVAHMGYRDRGLFAFNQAGHRGRDDPDAEPRPCLGRAVPLRRRDL
jgi:NADH-quinone oxidoreductase subunit M